MRFDLFICYFWIDEFDNLNPFYFGVVGGSACKNTIYHGSMMEELAEHPPLLFTEVKMSLFFSCTLRHCCIYLIAELF